LGIFFTWSVFFGRAVVMRQGQIFGTRVGLGQSSLVWVWGWKVFTLGQKNLFWVRSKADWPLFYCGSKVCLGWVGSGPISIRLWLLSEQRRHILGCSTQFQISRIVNYLNDCTIYHIKKPANIILILIDQIRFVSFCYYRRCLGWKSIWENKFYVIG